MGELGKQVSLNIAFFRISFECSSEAHISLLNATSYLFNGICNSCYTDDELLKIALASQLIKGIKLVLHNQILHNGQFAFG
jgi:hypothetical protein